MIAQKKIDEEILAFLSETDEVRYKELREKLLNLGFKEITFIRHLKSLRNDGEINRTVKEDRSAWYSVSDKAKIKAKVFSTSSDLSRLAAEMKSYEDIPISLKEFEIPSIPPYPIFKKLHQTRDDDPLYLTQTGLKNALYKGLAKSASVTIFSNLELPTDMVSTYPLAEAYLNIFGLLFERNVKEYDYIKSLVNKFKEKCAAPLNAFLDRVFKEEDIGLLSKRFLKGELLPKEEELMKQVVKDTIEIEKERIGRIIDRLNFKFHISVSFKSEKLAQALREYEEKLDNLENEHMNYIRKCVAKELTKKVSEKASV